MNESKTENPFAIAASKKPVALEAAASRATQEVQAALVMARKFPRDQIVAYDKIMLACRRKGLAEESAYAYKKGGTLVSGPTIRLLEVILQSWGNAQSGIVELERRVGESTVLSFAWDLETNYYDSKTFSVPHQVELKSGVKKLITDDREIYEHVANYGARRKRACMEAVIPRDVIDDALAECEKTLRSENSEPIIDRVRKMAASFSEFGVTPAMIEKRLGHKLDATIEQEVILLGKIYKSIRDGMGKREEYFEVETAPQPFRPPDNPELEPVTKPSSNKFKMTLEPPPGDGINIVSGGPIASKLAAPVVRTIHEEFQQFMTENGFKFDHLQSWGEGSGNIPDASSKASLEEVDGHTLVRLLKAKRGLLEGLKAAKREACPI